MTARQDGWNGVRAIAPLLPSLVPFGVITGIAAIEAGIPAELAIAMSSVLYAGASQLAAISLIETNAPVVVILFTVVVINLRFTIYSTSLATHFRSFDARWRLVCAYFVSDHSYAASIPTLSSEEATRQNLLWFYLGAAVPPWLVWQASTIVGVTVGTRLPVVWSLEFTIPLAFIGLLFATLDDRPAGVVAVTAGSVESVATALPYSLGLVLATFCGIGVGVVVNRRQNAWRPVRGG